ncbi:MAG: hypothetical protein FJX23_03495 [Alphaproteobacteria bacterium]|nr:hypothetical protein [Alphaproteobacteria bacterium]
MHIFIFFIVLKVVLTVAIIMGCAWLLAEYSPIIGREIAQMADGTWFESIGDWIHKGLKAIGRYSGKFLKVCFEWLEVLGFDFKELKESIKDIDLDEAADAAGA